MIDGLIYSLSCGALAAVWIMTPGEDRVLLAAGAALALFIASGNLGII